MSKGNFERIVVDGKFIGFILDQGRHGWFVQLPGSAECTAPRWGLSRDEAVEYLKAQAAPGVGTAAERGGS